MVVPPPDDELTALPERSWQARLASWLERGCLVGVRGSIPGMFLATGLLLLYVAGGLLATALGLWAPQYPFLSLAGDPVFTLLGFLSGLSVCLGTGSLIVLYLMRGMDSTREHISVLSAFTGFGFGASVIRFTIPTVLEFLTTLW